MKLFFSLLCLIVNTLAFADEPVVRKLYFQHEAYEFELYIVTSDRMVWIDDFSMSIDRSVEMPLEVDNNPETERLREATTELGPYRMQNSRFIRAFFSFSHPQLGESMIVDFKDGSFLVMNNDLKGFHFSSPFHAGLTPLEPELIYTRSLPGYYLRMTPLHKNRVIWPLDAGFHVYKHHPDYNIPWFPRSLQLYVQSAGQCGRALVSQRNETSTLFPMLFGSHSGM